MILHGWLLLNLFLPLTALADPVIMRGINFGDMLEVPPGQRWSKPLDNDYFSLIRQAGFDTIRVPIDWVDHAGPGPGYTIDPAFFQRIDRVVARAKESGLNAILDYHTDRELMDDPDAHAERFVTVWKQIAGHYRQEPGSILFELLNEPVRKLDSARWNALIVRTLAVIRPTNPTRVVVVGSADWNSFEKLPELRLPENDRHLLPTFHYYLPMQFTHQGAGWVDGSTPWLGTKWKGTAEQRAVIARDFRTARDWARANNRPLYLGEFGAYSKGDLESRVRWTDCCARTAEELGIGWSYWEFCSGFGAYDPATRQWREPLLHALIPSDAR